MLKFRLSVLLGVLIAISSVSAEVTLIAPMVEGLRGCKSASENLEITDTKVALEYCRKRNESAAILLEDELAKIGPNLSKDGKFALGYTLNLPLFSYIEFNTAGDIKINRKLIKQDLQLLSESDRSLVLYLFANHFVGSAEPVTLQMLAKDPESTMTLSDGSVPGDKYFGSAVMPWSIGNGNSLIRRAKSLATEAVTLEICQLSAKDIAKIHAVTVLGETHHFFPNFKTGMGYFQPYITTDYSDYSVKKFRHWLRDKFGKIERFNARLQSNFESFDAVQPPSKDISKDRLGNFFEHIDHYSSGIVPFFGWAYSKTNETFEILVYLNGQYIGDAVTGFTRLDVAQRTPGLENSNVGYRFDLNFALLPPGIHQVELRFLKAGKTSLLKKYDLAVMDRRQSKPRKIRQRDLSSVEETSSNDLKFWSDHPPNLIALFYNPLSKLWKEFRQYQVRNEIEYFSKQVIASCIESEKVFSAQIGSMYVGSWNPDYFAAEASLEKNEYYSQGINLYGGIVYGDLLFDWLEQKQHSKYGVPEMHPMTRQEQQTLVNAFHRHHQAGAYFLAPYYISIKPDRFGLDSEHEKYRVSPDNPNWGSAEYYGALQVIMGTVRKSP